MKKNIFIPACAPLCLSVNKDFNVSSVQRFLGCQIDQMARDERQTEHGGKTNIDSTQLECVRQHC